MQQPCPVCRGEGSILKNPCRQCRGSGRTQVQKKLALKIPKGVETGSRLRLTGKGEPGKRGGPDGDLHVILHVRENTLFAREGDDLHCKVFVTPDKAALGGTLEVPTIDGFASINIAAGTPNGKVIRLRGKGAPMVNDSGRGDLLAHIAVEVPVTLSPRQKKAMDEFAAAFESRSYPEARRQRELTAAMLEKRDVLSKRA
jgi:molecular chaperone DnaJ